MYSLPPEAAIGMAVNIAGDARLAIEIVPLPARNTTTNLRVLPSLDKVVPMNVDVTHTQLGLVLCHVLTEAHDGSIERISNHGHRLMLPLITSDLEEIINNDG
jgi:hypothetical protein